MVNEKYWMMVRARMKTDRDQAGTLETAWFGAGVEVLAGVAAAEVAPAADEAPASAEVGAAVDAVIVYRQAALTITPSRGPVDQVMRTTADPGVLKTNRLFT